MNFNGKSQPSQTASFYACIAPSGFQKPAIVEQTQSYITISWQPPTDDGGCRILSYAVFRDDGASGPINTEVNANLDPLVRNLPSLNSLKVTNFPTGSQGSTFRFQIKVITTQSEALSGISFVILAGLPLQPTDVPVSDPLVTNDKQIKVSFASP